jgi:catechol 2,3-dioxygenase-like lactoylglutathione lyase family enzyme
MTNPSTNPEKQPLTLGVHHVGLTVPELAPTLRFFTELLGWKEVGGNPDYPAVFVSDGSVMVTLWRAKDPGNAAPFDKNNNVGLHHLALRVADLETLEMFYRKLDAAADVRIEFAPEPLRNGPAMHMMCYEPGGNRIEFIVPADSV